ncbi:glycoside hydrolase family 99-like domain-containing protein [Romboutsia ilealis]|uniref:glycosyltransferase WbsX family protein n=2 Tax=Romboutsia ilealis TaxID=1115758 RepID=UPI002574287F|nr:glycoside hydrolase family 99-like domain-containing protein [Romboutsia ilealis]
MKSFLKKIYWKLPINYKLKEKISQRRFEKIIKKEEVQDKNKKVEIVDNKEVLYSYVKSNLEQYGSKSEYFKEYSELIEENINSNVDIAAYYLTQFHPNPENDAWWGKGTTEWNNVNQGTPQYVGHYQPRRPGEFGYYDLRLKDNMQRQIEVAKNYGVNIFCFYYYWFDGKRLLERPLNMFLENEDLDINFCYCWANENWTKRFSGTDEGILMKITNSKENYKEFIQSVLMDFKDNRYYKINNKPVISIYRPSLIPEAKEVLEYWRNKVKEEIGMDLYIVAVQERDTSFDWTTIGFDAETEFQPKQIQHNCKDITKNISTLRKDFGGVIYDYEDLVNHKKYTIKDNLKKKVYPAVMPMWDNTARRNFRGTIFHGSTPELYKKWLYDVLCMVKKRNNLDKNLIFINAWNEWGEGAYLEPDSYYGYAYLQATKEAITEAVLGDKSVN